jgi:SHS2 domain-containing protein
MKKWEHFDHDADIGIRGIGESLPEAFEMAAVALTAVVTAPEKVSVEYSVNLEFQSADIDFLFYDWINSIIYEMDLRSMIFGQFLVGINDLKLDAIIKGEKIDNQKHQPAVGIKGATLTELKVVRQNDIWIAQCIVDV